MKPVRGEYFFWIPLCSAVNEQIADIVGESKDYKGLWLVEYPTEKGDMKRQAIKHDSKNNRWVSVSKSEMTALKEGKKKAENPFA